MKKTPASRAKLRILRVQTLSHMWDMPCTTAHIAKCLDMKEAQVLILAKKLKLKKRKEHKIALALSARY